MKEGGRLRNAVRQRALSRVGRAIGADVRGQATVEAAYLIPVVFLCLLLLVQPGIILYDFTVMRSAAAEGCRLLATKTDAAGSSDEACIAYVKRRLSAVPPQDQFHIHDGACSWVIDVEGDESSEYVQVTIANKVKLLPLVDTGATLLGMTDASGEYSIEASSRMPTQPSWVGSSKSGRDPRAWIGGDR